MLEILHGSIFDSGAELLVNPVNCQGVAGKGLALEFRVRFPDSYRAYAKFCGTGVGLHPGMVFVDWCMSEARPSIAYFPTKKVWASPSQYPWIEQGLAVLRDDVYYQAIKSIAMPALGCGLGGLDLARVQPMVEKFEARVRRFSPRCRVVLCLP